MELYEHVAADYVKVRTPDRRIEAAIHAALGGAESVVNVGAGTGSYEPSDRFVVAVEPNASMTAQRSAGAAPVVRAFAEHLPLRDGRFGAALVVLSIHHWRSVTQGLEELRRVARERIVILTRDPSSTGFWLVQDYFPQILSLDQKTFPRLEELEATLGPIEVIPLPIPHDCTDGFLGAYWRRPHAYLEKKVTAGMSAFSRVSQVGDGLKRLKRDLDAGFWHERHGDLLDRESLEIGYRIVVANLST